jgi:anti-anti-sigma regulatory factor
VEITIQGFIDGSTVEAVSRASSTLMASRPRYVELDLTGLTGASALGGAALRECVGVTREVSGKATISVASPAGRRVVLEAMAAVEPPAGE